MCSSDLSGMMALIDRGALPRVLPLEAVLGDGFVNSGQAPAIAVLAETMDDLASPDFWLEVSTASEAIRSSPTAAAAPAPRSSKPQPTRATTGRTAPTKTTTQRSVATSLETQMEAMLAELVYLDDESSTLSHWSLVERCFAALEQATGGQVADEVVTEMLMNLNVCVGRMGRADLVRELADHAERLHLSSSVIGTLQAFAQQGEVRGHETALRELLGRAEAAVNSADPAAVVAALGELLRRLPDVPAGADDEAEDVFRILIAPAAVLELTQLRDELARVLPRCVTEVQRRLGPLVADLTAMLHETAFVLEHIRTNPGCLQSKIADALALDKARVRWVMWNLDHFARVTRMKSGSSYLVSMNE